MKKIWKTFDISLISYIFAIIFFAFVLFYNRNYGIIGLSVSSALFILKAVYLTSRRSKLLRKIKTVSDELNFEQGKAFEKLTVPCAVIENNGAIIWFNDSFAESFGINNKTKESNISQLIGTDKLSGLMSGMGYSVSVNNRYYSVYSSEITLEDEVIYLLYFFEQTKLKLIEKEFYATRPSVMLTVIDNADEVYQNFKDSECTSIFSRTEKIIDEWATSYGALCRKFSNARMLIFLQEQSLEKMIADKFTILQSIRDFTYHGRSTDISLSIGVGKSGDINKANQYARQAIDMAQSRGGDQVAIKTEGDYFFCGGVSEGFEKKNKVRTRLIAKTLSELISDSDNVVVMGHRFSDFDAFGSSVGIYSIARHLGIRANIVINRKATLASPLIEKFISADSEKALISPDKAKDYITDNTLLIITDTHKKNFTECPELLDLAKRVVVIDHHRKSVDYIDNTVMFYHIPGASSASEMVTEIIQYISNDDFISRTEATALMAGIMLDTRNFILRAGVRTFEAAAYLRSRGANTVECKKLFANDMELFRYRNAIIDMAKAYKGCAISSVADEFSDIRLVTSQAADEMLNIDEIKASFVIFNYGETVNISARSYGEMNVQLIAEKLGGGGHQTMSACQLKGVSLGKAEEMLKEAIDDYYSKL